MHTHSHWLHSNNPAGDVSPSWRTKEKLLFSTTRQKSLELRKKSVTQDCETAPNCDTTSRSLKYYPCMWTLSRHIHRAVYCQSNQAHANLAGNSWYYNKENENWLYSSTMMLWNSSMNHIVCEVLGVNQRPKTSWVWRTRLITKPKGHNPQWDQKVKASYKLCERKCLVLIRDRSNVRILQADPCGSNLGKRVWTSVLFNMCL